MYSFYSVVIISDRLYILHTYILEFNLGLSATAQSIPQLFGHYYTTISHSLMFDISPYSNNLGMRIFVSSNSAIHNGVVFEFLYMAILWSNGFDTFNLLQSRILDTSGPFQENQDISFSRSSLDQTQVLFWVWNQNLPKF